MTDRELLEKAAKAAGVTHPDILRAHMASNWNPLEDDGDAFRLMVKLRLSVGNHNDISQPDPWLHVEDRDGRWTHAGPSSEFNADPYAATRRAIVRAAAAIGETK